ncbi:alanine racemase [Acidiferrobacter sp.]|jgi:alanine racemase|uniref:alanine racemase n=1 Tax=Acidiferrobacter sp. TaxID=1872107 RepID=UPI00261B4D4E|nr:alanine racemase [Acidiferrobacter sp.]
MRPACASLDASALRHNLAEVRALSGARVMAIVKANGYGHGLTWVAKTLAEADAFGVASLEEGRELRESGIRQEICLLEGFFDASEIPVILREHLTPVIHDHYQVEALKGVRGAGRCDVWIKVDTGMHRLGFEPAEVPAVMAELAALPCIARQGLLSHLACAEDADSAATRGQIERFEGLALPGLRRSLANSAGIMQWPAAHTDWVRPGLMLYGASPLAANTPAPARLKPVMTLRSRLISVRNRHKGDAIGYGGVYRCPQDMPVGVVGVGYGDGYPREFQTTVSVLVRGQRAPVIGRISMDMLTVDLRAVAGAQVGDEVILWGQGLPVEEIAHAAGTIPYTLLCGLTQRLPRRESL